MIDDWSPGRAHHREHHKNMNNTIIELKPDNTHLIRIPDKMYQELQEIGKTCLFDENIDVVSVIGFLINYYDVTMNYYHAPPLRHGKALLHQLLYGNEE